MELEKVKPTLCLIIANPHGGSTISNLIIGQHKKTFSAGIKSGFPNKGQFDDDNYCSCGLKAKDCQFWTSLYTNYLKRESNGINYIINMEKLYIEIIDQTGCSTIIDTDHSDKLIRLYSKFGSINLKVIFIDRELEAVAYSRLKRDRKSFPDRNVLRIYSYLSPLIKRWKNLPHEIHNACNELNIPLLRVNYESLCLDSKNELAKVGEFLQLNYDGVARAIENKDKLVKPEHLLKGNRALRNNIDKGITLKYDSAFNKMSYLDKTVINVMKYIDPFNQINKIRKVINL